MKSSNEYSNKSKSTSLLGVFIKFSIPKIRISSFWRSPPATSASIDVDGIFDVEGNGGGVDGDEVDVDGDGVKCIFVVWQ